MSDDPAFVLDYASAPRRLKWHAEWWYVVGIGLSVISIATIISYYRWLTFHFYPGPQYWIAGISSEDRQTLCYGPVLSTSLIFIGFVRQFLSRPRYTGPQASVLIIAVLFLLACWLAIPVAQAAFMLAQPSHGFAPKKFSPLVFGDSDLAARLGDAIAA